VPLDGHFVTISQSDLGPPLPEASTVKPSSPAALWLVAPESGTQVENPLVLPGAFCFWAWPADAAYDNATWEVHHRPRHRRDARRLASCCPWRRRPLS